jgi:hypothetical protein
MDRVAGAPLALVEALDSGVNLCAYIRGIFALLLGILKDAL